MAGHPDAAGMPLPAMPALIHFLRGQLDVATDLEVESDHERVRDSKKAMSQEPTSSPTKRSPSPSDDGEDSRREKAPRLSSTLKHADHMADHVPALWSPEAREVYAGSVTTTQSSGFEDDYYFRKDRRSTQLPSTKRGGEQPCRGQHAHSAGQTGPPGECDGWDSFFVELGYDIDSGEFEIFLSQPEAWAATATRRGRGEVRVGRLDPEKKAELVNAKDKVIQNWFSNSVVEAASRSGLSSRALVRMRWWCRDSWTWTWLTFVVNIRRRVAGHDSCTSPCARPWASTSTWAASPVPSDKGDASELERDVLCKPVKELAEAVGVSPGQVVRLRKAVYGLSNAPRQWWNDVRSKLSNIGSVDSSIEP